LSEREPKISIIVPVYKVEPYLRKCLDSIVNQTYRNLQIILVDDGSTDNCGKICDEYAAEDSRVEVVHQENGGVSAARNAGLALVTGDYIGWVDSDDWIEPDMYEYLLEHALQYHADIVVCGRVEHYRDKTLFKGWPQIEVLNTEVALRLLLKNDVMQNYLWDKLWKRELFENAIFPTGKTFEDIAVMHKLFAKSDIVVCLPDAKYNYLQRNGSIIDDQKIGNKINYYWAAKKRYDEMKEDWPQFERLLAAQCAASAISLWGVYCANSPEERHRYTKQLQEIAAFCRQYYMVALQEMTLGITGRSVLRLTPYAKWWSFALAGVFNWLYKLKHGRNL